jgi:multiple antibiotic resistance protein
MATTFTHTFAYELVTLFVILDPVSTIPIFLAATLGLARSDSLKVGAYAILISFVVLLVFIPLPSSRSASRSCWASM